MIRTVWLGHTVLYIFAKMHSWRRELCGYEKQHLTLYFTTHPLSPQGNSPLSHRLPGPLPCSAPVAASVQTQWKRARWQWVTQRSKWERVRRRRRGAAWSSSQRSERELVLWNANGWGCDIVRRESTKTKREEEEWEGSTSSGDTVMMLSFVWSLSPSSCRRNRSSAVTPTYLSQIKEMCCWQMPTPDLCLPSQVTNTHCE